MRRLAVPTRFDCHGTVMLVAAPRSAQPEVFWDEPDQQTPWAQTPMFGTHEKRYAVIQEY